MRRTINYLLAAGAAFSICALSACGKSGSEADTNVVEMNASDGSMNDMTGVESSTLDQAGTAATANETDEAGAANASNAQ